MADVRTKAILRIRDLQVYYGESHAIQGVDLLLYNRILSIVGRNGMGKTTLCNTITGLKRARGGSIMVAGREVSQLDSHKIARLGVGYVDDCLMLAVNYITGYAYNGTATPVQNSGVAFQLSLRTLGPDSLTQGF